MLSASLSKRGAYIGRFAPSPTGLLHFGSLIAAVGSYLQARVAHGEWHLRIDDLDLPRVVPGSADSIIRTLAAFGFEWQGAIVYQSTRRDAYAAAIEQLSRANRLYRCICSRSQIAEANQQSTLSVNDETIYSGRCRSQSISPDSAHALRCIAGDDSIHFKDTLQGDVTQNVATQVGDFVVRRRDHIHAYHLATVVDDAALGVTEVVRGADLLLSTPRQILLQRLLNAFTPDYFHLPLAVDSCGIKLSKASQSLVIDVQNATEILWQALRFLRQAPPEELRAVNLSELWTWSIAHWSPLTLVGCNRVTQPLVHQQESTGGQR